MSIKTDFIDLVDGQVNRGIYVRGGNGENLSAMSDPKAWIERREKPDETHTKAQNAARAIRLYVHKKSSAVPLAFGSTFFELRFIAAYLSVKYPLRM